MPFKIDPDEIENNHVRLATDANGDAVLVNKVTGETLTLDGNLRVSEILSAEGGGTSELRNYASITSAAVGITQTQRSGRVGDYVYYDPAHKGPYIDGADAYADVPSGGTLLLAEGTYNVDTEGVLHTSVPKTIRGVGRARHEDNSDHGTVIDSSQTAAAPIEFNAGTVRREGGGLRDVAVRQLAASNQPVVRVNNMSQTTIADCLISGNGGNVGKGVQYKGQSFFARQYRNHIAGWTDRGVSVEGTGYAYEFLQNFVSSASGINHTALYLDVERPIVIGGQYSAVGSGGCAIHVDAASNTKRSGAIILEPGIESTEYPLRVGGVNPRHSVFARFYATLPDVVNLLDLVNSHDGVYQPVYSASTTGGLANFQTTFGNLIELPAPHFAGMTISGTPANTDLIHARGAVWGDQLAAMPTGAVRILCDMAITQGAPVWHDKTEWRVATSTAFTPV